MPTPPKQEKIKCPITGKMIPKPPPRAVAAPPDENGNHTPAIAKRVEELEKEMAKQRTKFANLDPGKRAGVTGEKMSKAYRRLTLEFLNLTGRHPPKLYDEL